MSMGENGAALDREAHDSAEEDETILSSSFADLGKLGPMEVSAMHDHVGSIPFDHLPAVLPNTIRNIGEAPFSKLTLALVSQVDSSQGMAASPIFANAGDGIRALLCRQPENEHGHRRLIKGCLALFIGTILVFFVGVAAAQPQVRAGILGALSGQSALRRLLAEQTEMALAR